MPHSSGGGSHGGGSHHSSHRSSSHRSGSSVSSRRVQNTYFPGARRFVYLHRGTPTYVFADHDITQKRSPLRFLMLLFYLPFFFAISFMVKDTIVPPKKLTPNYNTDIIIRDEINVLDNTESLKRSLKAFYDKTGIAPAVFTVSNEDWLGRYSDLESYAYDLYVNAFSDEKHWLIVYSEPTEPDPEYVDWYWEGMQGNETDYILTSDRTDSFNSSLQRYFTTKSISVCDAISRAFDELTPGLMQWNFEPTVLLFLVIFAGFICFHAYFMVFHDPNRKYRNAQECPIEQPSVKLREESCPYCGSTYVVGRDTRCPNCQALIEVSDNNNF